MAGEATYLRERLLGRFDLNLLLTFAVLYRESSVSKAARCLSVGQPAVSNSLAKLRSEFSDPLFVRGYRRMYPTPRATEIAQAVLPALELVQNTLITSGDSARRQRSP